MMTDTLTERERAARAVLARLPLRCADGSADDDGRLITWPTLGDALEHATGDVIWADVDPALGAVPGHAGRRVAERDRDGRWVVAWPTVASALCGRTEAEHLHRVVRGGSDPAGSLWTDIEIAAGYHDWPLTRPPESRLRAGRVRPEGGRWIAEQGSGGTLRAVGTYDNIAEAEAAVRDACAAERERLAAQLDGLGPDGAILASRVRAYGGCRIETWASQGERLRQHPVGPPEIAARLGVERATVDKWRTRGLLPDPDWTVGGRPAWAWNTIETWAHETGRL